LQGSALPAGSHRLEDFLLLNPRMPYRYTVLSMAILAPDEFLCSIKQSNTGSVKAVLVTPGEQARFSNPMP